MLKVGYRENEWLAVYVDENGERQIVPFDTHEKATEFIECCQCKIGVVTTRFYNRYVEKVIEGN